jgi:hypothetical protein
MKHSPRHEKTPPPADRGPSRERDGAPREPRRERERRMDAAQLAAPTSRTWRRAGRFGLPT